jgi:Family of unknown function (DUF6504)
MTKLYSEPISVYCRQDVPASFVWRRQRHHITAILKRWIVQVDWWRQEISRQYYKVECEGLGTYEIYHTPEGWYMERVYD